MIRIESITQPGDGSTLDAVSFVLQHNQVYRIDIAAAYMTVGGTEDLVAAMTSSLGAEWCDVQKRWITSFDYLRTEPLALKTVSALPQSNVRIHDAPTLLRNNCIPATPFHPKVFLFEGSNADFVLAGSGNVSRSGLRKGHEAGILIGIERSDLEQHSGAAQCFRTFRSWYDTLWDDAYSLGSKLLAQYKNVYESEEHLSQPTPTEDDLLPRSTKRPPLNFDDLRKLRVCESFWMEAGNITRNYGQGLPGNQLMMKRFSRVYFGVPPMDVAPNTPLSHVRVAFGSNASKECSLTFSDNGMDKLTLPIPGEDGPSKYDNEDLLFRRVGPRDFQLSLGTKAEKASWVRRSKAIGASFKMSSGRAWGVF